MHDSIDDTASGRIMGGKGKSGLKTQLTILSSNAGFASVLATHHILAHITVSESWRLRLRRPLAWKAAVRKVLSFGMAVRAGAYPRMLRPARVLSYRHEGTKKSPDCSGP
jgi:hypothetical protein